MDSFESRMNPSFLAESEKRMLWEPRVIESGRETVEGFKEEEKRRASVLSSFSLSRFFVIHVFMSSVHALCSLVSLVTSLSGADFWSCVSSAKTWWFTEWLAMISERGVVYRTKRMGPSTEPWGTPYMRCDGDEDESLTEVDWYLSERYDWNDWSAADWIPKTEFRRERRIWWSIVSKAAERSNKIRTEMLSLSRAERISFIIRNKKVSDKIRLLLVYYGLWVSIMRGVMGYSSARWRVRIISGCFSRTRSVISGIFRQYILIAGLCRHSSVVAFLLSIVNRQLS